MTIRMLKKKTIGITGGDPSSIAPEIIVKTLNKRSLSHGAHFIVIANENLLKSYGLRRRPNIEIIDPSPLSSQSFSIGRPNRHAAKAAMAYLEQACEMLKNKKIDSLVTAPLSKQMICSLGYNFRGHTEFLAESFMIKNYEMMFVAKSIKLVLATRHIPLKQIPEKLSKKNILKTLTLTHQALRKLFKIKKPKIALCGINPHAGEQGHMGNEERTILLPAIREALRKGISAQGPLPADTLFCPQHIKRYDGIIAMYHDQGLAPLKALYFKELVNLTIGLPFIRTSPAHGTAYDIAGKNQADETSMEQSIVLAHRLMNFSKA